MRYYKIKEVNKDEKFYETDNRQFEQFAHDHLINFIEQHKNEAGRNVWTYKVSEHFKTVVNEFNTLAM